MNGGDSDEDEDDGDDQQSLIRINNANEGAVAQTAQAIDEDDDLLSDDENDGQF